MVTTIKSTISPTEKATSPLAICASFGMNGAPAIVPSRMSAVPAVRLEREEPTEEQRQGGDRDEVPQQHASQQPAIAQGSDDLPQRHAHADREHARDDESQNADLGHELQRLTDHLHPPLISSGWRAGQRPTSARSVVRRLTAPVQSPWRRRRREAVLLTCAGGCATVRSPDDKRHESPAYAASWLSHAGRGERGRIVGRSTPIRCPGPPASAGRAIPARSSTRRRG